MTPQPTGGAREAVCCPKCGAIGRKGPWGFNIFDCGSAEAFGGGLEPRSYDCRIAELSRDLAAVRAENEELRELLKQSHPLDGDAAERCQTWDDESITAALASRRSTVPAAEGEAGT